ncbi:MAG TPA: septal ring lytic transglycosylase RlpA family protein [Candidatus Cloacimonadota bacterium]|nr:septal ring lytic transglycosylase RlpA family protein [Candidatus Cloacimonadota bacterium]HPY96304.1 septal ring lytic transglycosylase RlpA family protein [Candidatus Cloacimonadota bacterium]HQB40997.1 septal ring lytic transglycosylase RlpA family protein [Candidatus Cloacimonadota bacterium]
MILPRRIKLLYFVLILAALLFLNACTSAVIYSNAVGTSQKQKPSTLKTGWQEMTVSFYGDDFHGNITANGEVFDMNKMTAAHKTLDFGTTLIVWDEETDKKITVRINDRGPFIAGRDLDLSKGAARELGIIGAGVKKVKVKIAD